MFSTKNWKNDFYIVEHNVKCQKSLNPFPQNIGTQIISIIRESQVYQSQRHGLQYAHVFKGMERKASLQLRVETFRSEQWEINIAGSSFSDEEETGEGRS